MSGAMAARARAARWLRAFFSAAPISAVVLAGVGRFGQLEDGIVTEAAVARAGPR